MEQTFTIYARLMNPYKSSYKAVSSPRFYKQDEYDQVLDGTEIDNTRTSIFILKNLIWILLTLDLNQKIRCKIRRQKIVVGVSMKSLQ